MPLPDEPITLNSQQIDELNHKLVTLRHDVNNHLSLIVATAEIIRRRPEAADRMWPNLDEQSRKIADAVAKFSREMEIALHIRPPE